MGLVLDTSVLIAAERKHKSIQRLLAELFASYENEEFRIAAMSVVELVHGIYRAKSEADRNQRERFVLDVLAGFRVEPLTVDIAKLAGQIGGEQASGGNIVASEDLIIGATALHLQYGVVTHNFRHFDRIPGLRVQRL